MRKELRVNVKIPFVPNEVFVVISARKRKREKNIVALKICSEIFSLCGIRLYLQQFNQCSICLTSYKNRVAS